MRTDNTTGGESVLDHAEEERDRRGAPWRWNLAEEFLGRWPGWLQRHFGQDVVVDVQHYRSLCARGPIGRTQAANLYPAIAAADELNADPVKTGHLKVAVLGELDSTEISNRLGLDAAIVNTWEKLFFDIRGLRQAVDWVDIHVIKPELVAGRGDLAARLRMVSALGATGARAILTADVRVPIREAEKLFQRQLRFRLKFDAAVEMTSDTPKTRLLFIKLSTRLQLEQKRLQFARERLEKKCTEALDRHELAKIRAEIALERLRNRSAARARQAEGIALADLGAQQSLELLAARRREKELAEREAIAARVAASPLSRIRWRQPEDLGGKASAPRGEYQAGHGARSPVLELFSTPLEAVVPMAVTPALVAVPA